jgi:hypothetical protein
MMEGELVQLEGVNQRADLGGALTTIQWQDSGGAARRFIDLTSWIAMCGLTMSQGPEPRAGETQCSFHSQRNSSHVCLTNLMLANVKNRVRGGDSVGIGKIEKMTGNVGVPRNRSGMVIRHGFGWCRLGDKGSLSRSILFALGLIAHLGRRLVMVAFGARWAILRAADSVQLHLPIFISSSPCMMHITFPVALMNMVWPEMAQESGLRRSPKGFTNLHGVDVLEVSSCVVVAAQLSDLIVHR